MANSKLKFRAWDKNRNSWIEECDLIIESNERMWAGDTNNPPLVQIEPKYVVFFTGFKDKKCKEIYEGDIVRFHYKTGVYKIGTVVWNDLFGSWDIDCPDFVSYKSLGQYKSVSEVIGNIFEHKHLLEVTE